MKSRRSITMSSQSVITVASAVRGRPSSSAISPKISPGWMILSTMSRPSAEGTLIFTEPERTPIKPLPRSPLEKMFSPRARVRLRMYEPRCSITCGGS
jgi:hypothetical protein